MEEVDGSNPSRSTKPFKHLPSLTVKHAVTGVQLESETLGCLDSLWACVGSRYPPIIKPYDSKRWHVWALGQRFSRVLFAGEDNIWFPIRRLPISPKPESLRNLLSRFTCCRPHSGLGAVRELRQRLIPEERVGTSAHSRPDVQMDRSTLHRQGRSIESFSPTKRPDRP